MYSYFEETIEECKRDAKTAEIQSGLQELSCLSLTLVILLQLHFPLLFCSYFLYWMRRQFTCKDLLLHLIFRFLSCFILDHTYCVLWQVHQARVMVRHIPQAEYPPMLITRVKMRFSCFGPSLRVTLYEINYRKQCQDVKRSENRKTVFGI
jgi:hypothetical protein